MYDMTAIWLILPLIVIGFGSLLVLLMGTFRKISPSILFITTVSAIGLALFQLFIRLHAPHSLLFGHAFQFDEEATLFKMLILGLMLIVLIYARPSIETYKKNIAEFYSLVLLSSMGMMLLASAVHLVAIFLGIELMSLPLYALVAIYRDDQKASEAALKYFITGALSSGLLLFGFAWLYGATGTMELSALANIAPNNLWLTMAEVFIIAGLGFKFGVAPFHMWVPDVYEAAPTAVTAVIATGPKVAMTALLLNLFGVITPIASQWLPMLVLIALVSMLLGNIVALVQTNFKRMLAYSSVGHMGIIFLAVAMNSATGMNSALFYIFTYALTTAVVFSVLMQLKINYQEVANTNELAGLAKNYPLQAFAILCAMFSMAGVPPLVGFMAKFMVLDVVIAAKHYLWAGILVLCSVIGAVYYLRVIRTMYFKAADTSAILLSSKAANIALILLALALVLFGIKPFVLLGAFGPWG